MVATAAMLHVAHFLQSEVCSNCGSTLDGPHIAFLLSTLLLFYRHLGTAGCKLHSDGITYYKDQFSGAIPLALDIGSSVAAHRRRNRFFEFVPICCCLNHRSVYLLEDKL
mmetsp:Transcript_22760/g.47497  ORF Transcript_22760/g.47497 Transcript_22760/m.47497 type:complete len:110 (+) Transcript_22760:96-425(+)